MTLALDADSKISFTGVAEETETEGEAIMLVEDILWFDNWHDGWTEAEIACTGKIAAKRDGANWSIRTTEPVILAHTTKATIRYRDALLRGDDARDLLDRRLLRIRSACEYVREKLESREFALYDSEESGHRNATFRYVAGKLLFPEVYGYADGATAAKGAKGDPARYRKGEGFRWDTLYSQQAIPEEIREVRDTGTLWRDWEEMGRMFYYIYMMER